jgi:NADH:ubiquinone oxidoreductase subunit 5 (subunit L)/multisubunit Na+/H+ antiporter MnhA subunit
VTAYLHAAAMVKAGVYLVSRCYFLFGGIQEKVIISIMIATVGSFTLVIGTMAAWAQEDVKKLLAFSTIGQIGYIFLGLGLGTNLGTTAALFHYLNHAIFKGLLFLCAGCLIYATGTKNLNEMGGLARNMPITAGAMIIGGLSLAGVPPLNGFASKLLIYEAILETSWTAQGIVGKLYIFYFVLALLGSVASLAALMKVIHVAFLGRRPERLKDVKEVPWGMRIPLLVLSALCLIFGIAPQIPLALLINPVAGQVVPVVAFGYETFIGSYQATLLTGLILLSLLIGAIIYFAVTRRKSSISSDEKYGIFTGGEVESPYLELEKMKVGSEPFIFAPQKVLSSAYNFMRQGGIDIIYLGIARSVQRFSIWFSALTSTNIGIAALFLVLIGVAIFTPPHAGAMLMMLGALMALAQSDLRRMLAWASVSQIGHIILELASGIDEGRVGGILHLLNFAIFGALLYLSILAVIRRTNTKMVGEIAGLSYGMPVTALAFLIGGLSMAGLPPLSGWWSEFYILDTTIKMARPELTFAVAIVSALTLAYVVRAFHRVFLGETPDRYRSITEAPLRSLIPIALLILLTLIIGIYPFPWISLIEHVLESLR